MRWRDVAVSAAAELIRLTVNPLGPAKPAVADVRSGYPGTRPRGRQARLVNMKSVSIIGCGFVADYYMLTLSKSETLKVAGVFDAIQERAVKLAERYSIPKVYDSLEALLGDDAVEIVINLTNPRKHYETTMACLEAGKHVYSEKPMAMTVEAAKRLVEVAERKSLRISTAPSPKAKQ